ncbi:autotransporter outer membrane beta-barrel domain-containing protein [Caulobacter sp. KR2-114]|uniref:autotransporter outer membrane beta-barrel domain-containing protein n=1 Tax=Caulobacter sp. KR2-114 TaxID=3400912 RepID=UPI003BFCB81C
MMRRSLVAAVAAAPLLAVLGASAHAATSVSSSTTTPLATTAAGDIDIATGGSINPANNTAPAVTIDSSNKLTIEGSITFKDVDNAVAVLAKGGNTGSITSTGVISITETYAATDTNSDGVVDGVFSKQTGGKGIELVAGSGPAFTGNITNTGTITLQGNGAVGISIESELNGSLQSFTVSPLPITSSSSSTYTAGSISVTGNNAIGIAIAPTGKVDGNVTVAAVSATGVGATGVSVLGNVGGAVVFNGAVTTTGYRTISPTTTTATLATYTADELQQSGSAVVIGASVGQGVIVVGPVKNADSTKPDSDNNNIPDANQAGSILVYGSAPAMKIGAQGVNVTLGKLTSGDTNYGFVNQGTISAAGIYDVITTPNLPGPVSATAVEIGVTGDTTGSSVIQGGMHNTGTISAAALDANSTAIRVTTGGSAAQIVNDGSLTATSTDSYTTDPGARPTSTALQINAGGNVASFTNSGAVIALVTGTIAPTVSGTIGSAYAIRDQSGTLVNVANTGSITASVLQTISASTTSDPVVASTNLTTVAIDLSAGTHAETITQAQGPDIVTGTTTTTTTAAAAPSITGDILLGSGDDTVNIQAGKVTGAIAFGAGNNTLTIDGSANPVTGETTPRVTSVTGAITDTGGTLTVNLGRGQLSVTNAAAINATAVNVSSNGTLLFAADPANNKNTDFVTTGNSVIGAGATLGLTLQSLQTNLTQQYTVLETAIAGGVKQGSISASTFNTGQLANAPYLFSATASYQAGATAADADKVVLTVSRKTAAQLGFNTAESQAYSEVFNALLQDSDIQKAVLAQTTKSGLITVYDQMLPDQGQGVFDTLDQATQSVAALTAQTPDAGTRVAGSSLWLQEVNERVKRGSGATLGSQSQLFGVVGGWEHMGAGGGALGVTFSYLNIQDRDSAAAVGEHTVGSLLELGGYYRRAIGGLRISARGAGGYAFFNEDRQLVYTGVQRRALSNWGGYFADAHVGAAYEVHLGRFYARPELSADYLYLRENGHTETGGGDGFDLAISARSSHRLSGEAIVTLGTQFGRTTWLRPEIRGGYRRIFSGDMGDTTARFTSSSTPFTLTGAPDTGGWFTVGFSLKGGTNLSYLALEGDADFRDGEQRYNLFLSGRSMF